MIGQIELIQKIWREDFPLSVYISLFLIFSLSMSNCSLVNVQMLSFSPIITLSSCTSTTGHFSGIHTSPIHNTTFIFIPLLTYVIILMSTILNNFWYNCSFQLDFFINKNKFIVELTINII